MVIPGRYLLNFFCFWLLGLTASVNGECGPDPTWCETKYPNKNVVLMPVDSIPDYAFCNCDTIETINIPTSVKSIGKRAFYGATNLVTITYLSREITSIGLQAFQGVSNLQHFQLSALTNLKSIGESAFQDATSLSVGLSIPNSVTSLGKFAFKGCVAARGVPLGSGLTSINEGTFSGMKALTSITIPSGVKSIGMGAFEGCENMVKVTFPSGLTTIGASAFAGCEKLNDVNLDDTSVRELGNDAFNGSIALTSVELPQSLISIGNRAFANCNNLKLIDIPDTVEVMGEGAFEYNRKLESVTLGRLTEIADSAFLYAVSLKEITIPASVTRIGDKAFMLCASLVSITIPDKTLEIGKYAFSKCASLKSVDLGRGLLDIANYAFANTALESVNVPPSVTKVGSYAFQKCSSLVSANVANATDIGSNAFQSCISLVSMNVAATNIGSFAFQNCISLISANVTATNIGQYALQKCNSLVSANVTATNIGQYALQKCNSLVSANVAATNIGRRAIGSNPNLKTVTFGSPYTEYLDFGIESLYDNPKLTNVTIVGKKIEFKAGVFKGTLNVKEFKLGRILEEIVDKRNLLGTLSDPLLCVTVDGASSCGCEKGYGNILVGQPEYFSCSPCGAGSSSNGTQAGCFQCPEGSYSSAPRAPFCELCPPGRYGEEKGGTSADTSCRDCQKGKFNSVPGAGECLDCPAGSMCPDLGEDAYKACDPGHYNRYPSRVKCEPCPKGTYQSKKGSAFCESCPLGKYGNSTKAVNVNECTPCPLGMYGDATGAEVCKDCSEGYYQDQPGNDTCIKCKGGGDDTAVTSEAGSTSATDCVVKVYSSSSSETSLSIEELIISYGFDWSMTFVVALAFVAMAALVTYYREMDPKGLANYSRLEAFCHSFFPGFNFGASIFLMLLTKRDYPDIYGAMVFARLLHLLGGLLVISCLFMPEATAERAKVSTMIPGVREKVNRAFARENAWLVECICLLSLCDVTMLQYLPWRKAKFYVISEGWVTARLMMYCLVIKCMDTLITVACEIAYLDTADADAQTESFYSLNVVFGGVTIVADVLVLCLRANLLGSSSDDDDNDDDEDDDGTDGDSKGDTSNKETGTTLARSHKADKRMSATPGMEEAYPDEEPVKGGGGIEYVENPLMSVGGTQAGTKESEGGADKAQQVKASAKEEESSL